MDLDHQNHIIELFIGYSLLDKDRNEMKANCSVTLIKGTSKVILVSRQKSQQILSFLYLNFFDFQFDTLTAWDRDVLLQQLKSYHVRAEDVNFVVCSHGHSDHIGNLNLFLQADHFVGSCRSHKHIYYCHDFEKEAFVLDKDIEVISTPGHTSTCVTLIVRNTNIGQKGTVAVAGDLFEKEEDIFRESLWIDAGTEDEQLQRKNRLKVAELADYIIPGHGPMFQVTAEMREKLRKDCQL